MHWTPERVKATVVETEGWDLLIGALKQNKGVIGLAMHLATGSFTAHILTLFRRLRCRRRQTAARRLLH